ncbi:hypothetical protein FDECE_1102 [Fusarium decemcellulare]|nr:hypothetical protein FDECE_1102 [Fusarium decemcellulare]
MLPPGLANEIRNEPKLSFSKALYQDFHGGIPGFEPLSLVGDNFKLVIVVVRKQLTKLLGRVTSSLSEEAAAAVSINLADVEDWKDIQAQPMLLDIVARLSSRVFLGEELCRDEEWLQLTKRYTMTAFGAASQLRVYPRPLRRIIRWFIPACKQLRTEFAGARDKISTVIEKRRQLQRAAKQAGQPAPEFEDALEWADREAAALNVTVDPAIFQLTLSAAAIHTSTDLLVQVVLDLAQHPEFFQPLRDEICRVLKAEGWKKTSLYNMKLLDSVIKESQRMKPIGLATMRRLAEADVKLSTGLVVKKGMRVNVDSYNMRDPNVHDNPDQWDGYRFLKLRSQPGKDNMAQLVSTNEDHIAFGHGKHACPGRFFAANELKIALCHLLIKYDWKLAMGTDTTPVVRGTSIDANRTTRILIRRRESVELDIDSI